MNTFRQIVEKQEIEAIKKAFGDNLLNFLDSLQFYIDFNDEQSKDEILSYSKQIKESGFLTSPKSVYRLAKIERKELNKKHKMSKLTSVSTEKMEGKMLELMKGMLDRTKPKGDYYYLEIAEVKGLDVNKFGEVFTKNKKSLLEEFNNAKELIYFYETIENKSGQKEFLIFGDYKIINRERI